MANKNHQVAVGLWNNFLDGDEGAFSELYCFYFEDLMHYGSRICINKELTEDLIQDIFVRLYLRKISPDDPSRLRPFLYRSLKNAIINSLIREARCTSIDDPEIIFNLSYTIEDHILAQQDLTEEIEKIMSCLSQRQKEIIYLRFVQEMTFEEISAILDMNVQSAYNLLSRSVKKLRQVNQHMLFLP